MAVPLFGRANGHAAPSALSYRSGEASTSDDRKQRTFMQLKSICVPLLSSCRINPPTPTSTQQVVQHLSQLGIALSNIPSSDFTPALANYVFFPLSALLQPSTPPRSEAILEATIRGLTRLVAKWKEVEIDDRVKNELWILIALKLGGPLDPNKPTKGLSADAKGKAKQEHHMSDELKLTMVDALLELLMPVKVKETKTETVNEEDDDDPLGERIDWSADDPFAAAASAKGRAAHPPTPTSPPIPIVFHTLTTLLDLAVTPTSLIRLQLASLQALELLVRLYLSQHPPSTDSTPIPATREGPSPLLATALPGTASTLSRIALSATSSVSGASGRRQSSQVIVSALEVLTTLLLLVIDDDITAPLRSKIVGFDASSATLEEVVESYTEPNGEEDAGMGEEIESTPTAQGVASTEPPTTSATLGPTTPSPSWLTYTLRSISALLGSLSPLSSHDSPLVRAALAQLLASLEAQCRATLEVHRRVVLELLLCLAADDWPTVSSIARSALDPNASKSSSLVREVIIDHLGSLSRRLRAKDDAAVVRSARVVRSGLALLKDDDRAGLLNGLEKWKWTLLDACALHDVQGLASVRSGEGMSVAWIEGSTAPGVSEHATDWPVVRLRNVEEAPTTRELSLLWKEVGKVAVLAGKESEVVESFWSVVGGPRGADKISEAAIWVLDGVLQGVEGAEMTKPRKKVIRGLVKAVLGLMDRLEEGKDEELPKMEERSPSTDETSLVEDGQQGGAVAVQHQQGLTITPELNKYKPVASAAVTRDAKLSHRIWLQSLALRVISSCATLLEGSFQPHLLSALYHVLAHLSPATHPFLRSHAQHALLLISEATAYASPSNLVLANVDYVVNAVSQRLSITRLDPSAPLVLVEMIRLVGGPIVPMVQDLADDVFEALDCFHGYDEVTVGLWAVLDALMRVMAEEAVAANAEMQAETEAEPTRKADWEAFVEWYTTRDDPPDEELMDDAMPATNPERPFAETVPAPAEDEPEPSFPSDEPQAPATRPQEVAAQIIAKSVYFLSHSSPFLRARVLSLLASSVPLLALRSPMASAEAPPRLASTAREADLLPIIHRAWPYILNRFADPDPSVVLAASELIASLSHHVGSFLSRRILDDVWPRIKGLIDRQRELNQRSALKEGRYTVSFRIHRALLDTLANVTRDVPLKEEVLWDIAMALRRFLDRREESELREKAKEVYEAMGRVNSDAVWVVLEGLRGGGEEWMRVPGFEVGNEVDSLLLQL